MLRGGLQVPARKARPFRILISLLDRTNIGGPVVDALFEALITDLQEYQRKAPTQEAFDEVFRSANMFFDSIEPQLIARHILLLYQKKSLDLIDFILVNFNLDESDLTSDHVPVMTAVLSCGLLSDTKAAGVIVPDLDESQREQVARLVSLLADLLPGRSVVSLKEKNQQISLSAWIEEVYEFYEPTPRKPAQHYSSLSLLAEQILANNIASEAFEWMEDRPQ